MKMKWMTLPLLALLLGACGKNTDSIGEASTVFNLLGKNDRIEIEAFDDPDVHGVSCFFVVCQKRWPARNRELRRRCIRCQRIVRTNRAAGNI